MQVEEKKRYCVTIIIVLKENRRKFRHALK